MINFAAFKSVIGNWRLVITTYQLLITWLKPQSYFQQRKLTGVC